MYKEIKIKLTSTYKKIVWDMQPEVYKNSNTSKLSQEYESWNENKISENSDSNSLSNSLMCIFKLNERFDY